VEPGGFFEGTGPVLRFGSGPLEGLPLLGFWGSLLIRVNFLFRMGYQQGQGSNKFLGFIAPRQFT
jgi:hypothetical protein